VCEPAPGLRIYAAATFAARGLGLAFLGSIPAGTALHLDPCRSVHTFGMRFALDLIWLGPEGEVVATERNVPPRRIRSCRAARSVLEMSAGDADRFLESLAPDRDAPGAG
jgi:uncharacterized membrane protein (UPF0127 family)